MIAWYGTGLMGAGFVRKQRELGVDVNVWNRSSDKAKALEADGAHAFADPAEAAKGAKRIHLSLSDDASVDGVLGKILGSLEAGAVVIDHTTTAPTPTKERAESLAARGVTFQHAPVFMGPANTRDGSGIMLASGPKAIFDSLEPELQKMTTTVLYLGQRLDAASSYKLFGNMMLFFIASGLSDVFALAQSLGIKAPEAMELFSTFNPGNMIAGRGKKMAAGDFAAAFEMTMARKDIRLMIEEAGRHNVTLDTLPTIAGVLDRAIAAGHGRDDMGAIASKYVK